MFQSYKSEFLGQYGISVKEYRNGDFELDLDMDMATFHDKATYQSHEVIE